MILSILFHAFAASDQKHSGLEPGAQHRSWRSLPPSPLRTTGSETGADCVVLLHGLARTSASMERMADALHEQGYTVINLDYPSREKPIEELAASAVQQGVDHCRARGAAQSTSSPTPWAAS